MIYLYVTIFAVTATAFFESRAEVALKCNLILIDYKPHLGQTSSKKKGKTYTNQ